MLKIRLKRIGRRGQPYYRIVVMENKSPRDGRSIEEIGFYNPRTQPATFEIDKDAAIKWLSKGAQPSDTIAQYFVKLGLIKPTKKGSVKPNTTKKEKKKE